MPKKFSLLIIVSAASAIFLSAVGSAIAQDIAPRRQVEMLSNGFTYLLHRPLEKTDRVIVKLIVRAGTRYEELGQSGTAHLIEHIGAGGTPSYPKGSFLARVIAHGAAGDDAQCQASTGEFQTVYTCDIRKYGSVRVEDVIKMFSEIVNSVNLTDDAINTERETVVAEGGSDEQKSARSEFYTFMSGEDFYNISTMSAKSDLRRQETTGFKDFYGKWYGPARSTLIVVGDMEFTGLDYIVRSTFGKLMNGSAQSSDYRQIRPTAMSNASMIISSSNDDESILHLAYISPIHPKVKLVDLARAQVMEDIVNDLLAERAAYLSSRDSVISLITTQQALGRKGDYRNGIVAVARVDDGNLVSVSQIAEGAIRQLAKSGFSVGEVKRAQARLLAKESRTGATLTILSRAYDDAYASGLYNGDNFPILYDSDERRRAVLSISEKDVDEYLTVILKNSVKRVSLTRSGEDSKSRQFLSRIGEVVNSRSIVARKIVDVVPQFFSKSGKSDRIAPVSLESGGVWRGRLANGWELVVLHSTTPETRIQLFGATPKLTTVADRNQVLLSGSLGLSSLRVSEDASKALGRDIGLSLTYKISGDAGRLSFLALQPKSDEALISYVKLATDKAEKAIYRLGETSFLRAETDPAICGMAEVKPIGIDAEALPAAFLRGFQPKLIVISSAEEPQKIAEMMNGYLGAIRENVGLVAPPAELNFRDVTIAESGQELQSAEQEFLYHRTCMTAVGGVDEKSMIMSRLLALAMDGSIYSKIRDEDGLVYHASLSLAQFPSKLPGSEVYLFRHTFSASRDKSAYLFERVQKVLQQASKGEIADRDFDLAKTKLRSRLDDQIATDFSWVEQQVSRGERPLRSPTKDVLDSITVGDLRAFAKTFLTDMKISTSRSSE